jgi:ribose 5-phosphate isomerase B
MTVLAIAADHGGFGLKEEVKRALMAEGHEVVDLGTDSVQAVDYPIFGRALAEYIAGGKAEKGIAICGSGIGMSIAANRVKGIRCALVHSEEYARLAAAHNGANMISLGGRFTKAEDAVLYINIWLNTPFGEGRHRRRIEELDEV